MWVINKVRWCEGGSAQPMHAHVVGVPLFPSWFPQQKFQVHVITLPSQLLFHSGESMYFFWRLKPFWSLNLRLCMQHNYFICSLTFWYVWCVNSLCRVYTYGYTLVGEKKISMVSSRYNLYGNTCSSCSLTKFLCKIVIGSQLFWFIGV